MTFLLALLAAVSVAFSRNAWRSLLLFAVCLPLPVLLSLFAYSRGTWLPLVVQEAAVSLSLLGALAVNYATEGKQKRFIKNAFRQYLSPDVIEQLIAHPERLKLGGERRTLSIFFSDLQGFTAISEGLDPEALTALLNEYLSAMTDILHEEGGTVDKYVGDAIIAFWNAPLDQPDHAERAARAALRCQEKLSEMRPDFRERIGKDLYMRIGLNTGFAVVGNMGSRSRFDYTVLGDAVNLASRLEGINKQFGTFILSSEALRKRVAGDVPGPGDLPGRRRGKEGTGADLRAVFHERFRGPRKGTRRLRQRTQRVLRGEFFRGPRIVSFDRGDRSSRGRLRAEVPGADGASSGTLGWRVGHDRKVAPARSPGDVRGELTVRTGSCISFLCLMGW